MSGTFEAGVGVRDITPLHPEYLWGYLDREGPATGTLDPLLCKSIAFRSDSRIAVWCTMDWGRPPMARDCEAIRQGVAELGVDFVAFHATHTHHAPALEVFDEQKSALLVAGIVASIEEAVADLQPARIGHGITVIDIAHNRRYLEANGQCAMVWRNEQQVPLGPVDREATIVRLDRVDGSPLAALVHFACHPVVMDASNLQYSGDFVSDACRIAGSLTGAECFYLQGACADVNPYLDKTALDKGAYDAKFAVGRIVGEAVAHAWQQIHTEVPATPEVSVSETHIDAGIRWNLSDASERKLVETSHGLLFRHYIQCADDALRLPVCVLLLNREIALLGMPGEMYVRQQLRLKEDALIPGALLCGYVNDYFAYLPTVREAAAGGYGGSVGTYAGLGTAERLVTAGEVLLYRLLGRFKERHSAEDFEIREVDALAIGSAPRTSRKHSPQSTL